MKSTLNAETCWYLHRIRKYIKLEIRSCRSLSITQRTGNKRKRVTSSSRVEMMKLISRGTSVPLGSDCEIADSIDKRGVIPMAPAIQRSWRRVRGSRASGGVGRTNSPEIPMLTLKERSRVSSSALGLASDNFLGIENRPIHPLPFNSI